MDARAFLVHFLVLRQRVATNAQGIALIALHLRLHLLERSRIAHSCNLAKICHVRSPGLRPRSPTSKPISEYIPKGSSRFVTADCPNNRSRYSVGFSIFLRFFPAFF